MFQRLGHHIESSAATVESSFATLNNHILENRKDIQINLKKLSDLSAKADTKDLIVPLIVMPLIDYNNKQRTPWIEIQRRSRETASKRLAKRLALELKRHESGTVVEEVHNQLV